MNQTIQKCILQHNIRPVELMRQHSELLIPGRIKDSLPLQFIQNMLREPEQLTPELLTVAERFKEMSSHQHGAELSMLEFSFDRISGYTSAKYALLKAQQQCVAHDLLALLIMHVGRLILAHPAVINALVRNMMQTIYVEQQCTAVQWAIEWLALHRMITVNNDSTYTVSPDDCQRILTYMNTMYALVDDSDRFRFKGLADLDNQEMVTAAWSLLLLGSSELTYSYFINGVSISATIDKFLAINHVVESYPEWKQHVSKSCMGQVHRHLVDINTNVADEVLRLVDAGTNYPQCSQVFVMDRGAPSTLLPSNKESLVSWLRVAQVMFERKDYNNSLVGRAIWQSICNSIYVAWLRMPPGTLVGLMNFIHKHELIKHSKAIRYPGWFDHMPDILQSTEEFATPAYVKEYKRIHAKVRQGNGPKHPAICAQSIDTTLLSAIYKSL